jgi:hypothetical protein
MTEKKAPSERVINVLKPFFDDEIEGVLWQEQGCLPEGF